MSAFLSAAAAAQDPVTRGADPETGLRFWEWRAEGVLFRLTQRLPDQTRGFFQARGFDEPSADRAATACIFQSLFQNIGVEGAASVSVDQNEWRVVADDRSTVPLTREYWEPVWREAGLSPAARIAFEWSLLPTSLSYQPGDYNWGMVAFGPAPGTAFDLIFTWSRDGQRFSGTIPGIQCPPDIHPQPGEVL